MCATVLFRIQCHTEFKQSVKIVGNIPALGNWNPFYGFKLITDSQMYPLWCSDYALEAELCNTHREYLDQEIEFKVVITDERHCYWEQVQNRHFKICQHKTIIVLTFDNPSMTICGFPRLISETDLNQLYQDASRARRVSIQIQDHLDRSYSDSDDETESDLQSLFQEESTPSIALSSSRSIQTPSQGCIKTNISNFDICNFNGANLIC